MKYDNILLFTIPSTFHTGHFNRYFIENSHNLFLYIMPLSTQKPEVKLLHYKDKIQISEKKYYWYRGSNMLIRYVFFYLYYINIIIEILPRKTIIFATIPLFCILSSIFDKLKSIKVVYHVGDYYHNPKGIMKLFNFLTHYYNKNLKYVVYSSPVIEKIYRTRFPKKNGNREYWIFGIDNCRMIKKVKPNLLGYIGVLRQGQGIDIIFHALKISKQLKLEIMGDGPLLNNLKNEAKKLGLSKRVKFLGLINDKEQIVSYVSRWQIGLAPYDPSINNMTIYAEPSKIKFYLEHRLPVIMTKITYIYKELKKYNAGIAIDNSPQSLCQAITNIQNNYLKFVDGVDDLITKYEYNSLYDRQFKFFEKIW